MAKVYASPLPAPEYSWDDPHRDWEQVDAEYIEKVRALAKEAHSGNLIGEVIRFPIGDGQAHYMVWNTRPLEIVHLPLGDAYSIPAAHARGLNLSDIEEAVEYERRMRRMLDLHKRGNVG